EDESIYNHDDNVRTCPPSVRYVVFSSSSVETDILTSQVVSRWGPSTPENESRTSTAPDQCSPIDDFYDSQTIDSTIAQNIYVPNWDVTNDARIDDPIMCRNLVDRIVELRSKLKKVEGEAADVVELCRRVSELEATATVKAEELAGLSVRNAELSGQVSGLESVRDSLKGK
ncbi:hypothetical protein Tco_1140954, partial [Tanacetum coccineum]